MATTRISTLRALLQPKLVRIGLIFWGLLVSYDTISSQFELPTIRALLGMSGALLPWWGWLLILQAIFVYALFEYVRRNTGASASVAEAYDDSELRSRVVAAEQMGARAVEGLIPLADFEARFQALDSNTVAVLRHYNKMQGLPDSVEELERQYATLIQDYQTVLAVQADLKDQVAELTSARDVAELAFLALRSREKLKFYADIIREESKAMLDRYENQEPTKGDAWADWERHHNTFEGALSRWFRVAKGWQPKIEEWVERIDRADLTGERWKGIDALFETSDHSTIFKSFYLRLSNWGGLMGRVNGVVEAAAFGDPDQKKMLDQIAGGGPTPARVWEALND